VLLGSVFRAAAAAALVLAFVGDDEDQADRIADFQRVTFAQPSRTVQLDSGSWVGYYEAPGHAGAVLTVPNYRAFIRGPRGAQVNLAGYGALVRFRYYQAGRNGVSLFRFEAPQPGPYRILLRFPGVLASGTDLAIGRDLAKPGSSSRAVAFTVAAATAVLGFGALGWGLQRRSGQPHVVSGAS
jgi:hypothetical protein